MQSRPSQRTPQTRIHGKSCDLESWSITSHSLSPKGERSPGLGQGLDETAGRRSGQRPFILIAPATSRGAPGPWPSNPLNRAAAEDFPNLSKSAPELARILMQTNFSDPACFASTLAPPLFAGLHALIAFVSPAQATHSRSWAQQPVFRFKSLRILPCASVSCLLCFLVCPVGKTGAP